jgi:hypothetical protein
LAVLSSTSNNPGWRCFIGHFSNSRLAVIISFYPSLFLVYGLGNIGTIFRDALK